MSASEASVGAPAAPAAAADDPRAAEKTREGGAFYPILPVLFLEYAAVSLARGLLPSMFVAFFGGYSFIVSGIVESAKGTIAVASCPLFGRLSDRMGRKPCLLLTVIGTCLPVCIMAFTDNLWFYVVLQALSGFFAATFPLTFAYISDLVPHQERAAAYGLALATFGLSLTTGPIAGGFLAKRFGQQTVFAASSILVLVDLLFILALLPESRKDIEVHFQKLPERPTTPALPVAEPVDIQEGVDIDGDLAGTPRKEEDTKPKAESAPRLLKSPFTAELGARVSARVKGRRKWARQRLRTARENVSIFLQEVPSVAEWTNTDNFSILLNDEFLRRIAIVVLLYYTSVMAIVSTFVIYVTRHMHFSPLQTGWLLSAFGVCTMFAEGVLVRFVVPRIGERLAMQIGLAAFAVQCVFFALATKPVMIYSTMVFSLASNLVYPSICSVVSRHVDEEEQGEALGALNGVKALTEGSGPLVFGVLLSVCEGTPLPGAPYLIASAFAVFALRVALELPSDARRKQWREISKRKAKGSAADLQYTLDGDTDEGDDALLLGKQSLPADQGQQQPPFGLRDLFSWPKYESNGASGPAGWMSAAAASVNDAGVVAGGDHADALQVAAAFGAASEDNPATS